MRILIINDNTTLIGGAEQVITNMIAFFKKNHQISLLGFHSNDDGHNYIDKNTVIIKENKNNFIRLFGRIFFSFNLYVKLRTEINKIKPQIIDIHINRKYPFTVLLATRGYPSVTTIHDFGFLCLGLDAVSRDGKKLCMNGVSIHCLLNRTVSFKKFIALYISQKIYKIIEKHQIRSFIAMNKIMYNELINKGYETVYYLPNTTNLERAVNDSPKTVNNKNNIFKICYLGNLGKHKGIDIILKALPLIINKKGNQIELHIVTGGIVDSLFIKYVKELSLDENVKFYSQSSHQKAMNILKKCDILALPSICIENCPLSILEAMASGIPVIASKAGGIPELVLDGQTGLLFKPRNIREFADKIIFIIENPSLAKIMRQNAIKLYDHKYKPDRHYKELIQIYKKSLI